jgi:DEAD/DEAH box helicase domain-containing protein
MLHRSILPRHEQWSAFLRRLSFVVIDEAHVYRGVFGSHVAQVIRRLRRVARGTPRRVRSSSLPRRRPGTRGVGRPPDRLPVTAVTEDASPQPGVTFGLWEPPLLSGTEAGDAVPIRRSALMETADLLTDAVTNGVRTLAFVRSRRGAEAVATQARRGLKEAARAADRVAAYRAGYLREERRALEQRLLDGSLLGLAATNALELGIDVAGLDAVILAGYPGTLASLWQQAGGPAGPTTRRSACWSPATTRSTPISCTTRRPVRPGVEAAVLDPTNPYVLGPHLCCAAAELPLVPTTCRSSAATRPCRSSSAGAGGLPAQRPTGWYWAAKGRPDVDLRGTGGRRWRSSRRPPAGCSVRSTPPPPTYRCTRARSTCTRGRPMWSTARPRRRLGPGARRGAGLDDPPARRHGARRARRPLLCGRRAGRAVPGRRGGDQPGRRVPAATAVDRDIIDTCRWTCHRATCARSLSGGPSRRRRWRPPASAGRTCRARCTPPSTPRSACCRWWPPATAGTSAASPPRPRRHRRADRLRLRRAPGGAGFAERAFHAARDWLSATRTAIADCRCDTGCPSCVQSPKCGNGNEPLHKRGAVRTLDSVLRALAEERGGDRSGPG